MIKHLAASRSLRYAAGLALAYGLLSGGYIVLSSSLAADASRTVEQLRRIEQLKGILFVTVTSLAVLGGAYAALRRMEHDTRELLRRERAIVSAEGRVLAGLIASSVAHDANNVLMAVLGELDDLADDLPRGDDRLKRLHEAVTRLVQMNRRVLTATRQDTGRERHPVDVAGVARESVESVRAHTHVRGCRVDFHADAVIPAVTSPLLLHQMLNNLVLNAGEATGGQGSISVRVERAGTGAVIEVHDDGPGIPHERRATLFDALATTKPHGSGLGLFSVKACATGLGGRVEVSDSPLGGALFRVHLPLDAA